MRKSQAAKILPTGSGSIDKQDIEAEKATKPTSACYGLT
jgi:hypothetical protein